MQRNLRVCFFHIILLESQNQEGRNDWSCNKDERWEMRDERWRMKDAWTILVKNPEWKEYWEDLHVDGRIKLNWVVGKWGMVLWTAFISSSWNPFEHRNKISSFKRTRSSWLALRLSRMTLLYGFNYTSDWTECY